MRRPYFSIVTPALNCAQFLPRNLASVRTQGVPAEELEHWVIDGGSKDGTVELLREAGVKFISEPDRGLSDAVNKGIQRANGEWIIWLNADDELAPGALRAFQDVQKKSPQTHVFCGHQKIFGYHGEFEALSKSWDYNLKDLLGTRTSIVQASTFVHRSVYEAVGLLDVNCRDAMDYEWMVRAMHHYRCQPLDIVLTHYHRRLGSIMDANAAGFYRTFLRLRRHYGKSYFTAAELRIRFYLATEPFRRVSRVRRAVRRVKRLFGCEPTHPVPDKQTAPADDRIEVLHVVGGSGDLGGAMSFVKKLAAVHTANVRHFVWKSADFDAPPGNGIEWVCEGRTKLTDRSAALDILGAARDVPRLASWLRRHPNAILHAHTRLGQIASTWIAWRSGRPAVMHVHARARHPDLYRRAWEMARAEVVFNSSGTGRHFGWEPAKSQIVAPSIDWPTQPTPIRDIDGARVRFVAAGLFVPWKNFQVIVKAFKLLSWPAAEAELVLYGCSPPGSRSDCGLRIEAEALGNPAIRLMGWDPEWTHKLAAGDIFVHAAKDEPFGIVILEAFARGCRMVVPRNTFLDSLPKPLESTGIVRAGRPDDPASLAEAMKAAAETPLEAARLWEQRQVIRDSFSPQCANSRLTQIYQQFRRNGRGAKR